MDSQPTSSKNANNAMSNSATEEHLARRYAIYPEDGLIVDSISALLASYPDAGIDKHVSVNGWGVLYWQATLSLAQLHEVKANKQVRYHVYKYEFN